MARREYHTLTQELLEQMCKQWPDCLKVKALAVACAAMDDAAVEKSIAAHVSHLCQELPPQSVAYSAPLSRIRRRAGQAPWLKATYRDAYDYGDVDALLLSGHPMLETLDLSEKWTDLDPESRNGMFQFLRAISDAALAHHDLEPPPHVTVTEIEAEIGGNNTEEEGVPPAGDEPPPPPNQVAIHIECLAKQVGGEELAKEMEAVENNNVVEAWEAATAAAVGEAVAAKDAAGLKAAIAAASPADNVYGQRLLPAIAALDAEAIDELWPAFGQIGLLCRIHNGTPQHLIDIIQSKANEIAQSIADGEGIDQTSLLALGNEVMTQCSADDLQQFSKLISGELENIMASGDECLPPGLMEMATGAIAGSGGGGDDSTAAAEALLGLLGGGSS